MFRMQKYYKAGSLMFSIGRPEILRFWLTAGFVGCRQVQVLTYNVMNIVLTYNPN